MNYIKEKKKGKKNSCLLNHQCYYYISLTCVASVTLGLCCDGAMAGYVKLLVGQAVKLLRGGGAASALFHAGQILCVRRAALHGGRTEESWLRSRQLIILFLFFQVNLTPHTSTNTSVHRKTAAAASGCGSAGRILLPQT